jgi:hypothetical protein
MPPKKNARYDRMIEIIHKTTPSICCWQKSFRRASGEMQRLECWRVKNRLIILQTWGETGFQLFSDDTPATFDEIATWLASDSPLPHPPQDPKIVTSVRVCWSADGSRALAQLTRGLGIMWPALDVSDLVGSPETYSLKYVRNVVEACVARDGYTLADRAPITVDRKTQFDDGAGR